MAKTKIVVIQMKELIYTAIFAGLGILLIVLLIMAIDTGVGIMGTITLTAANLEATMAAGNLDRNQSLPLLSGS